jgi:thymidylate synthase (FAD)
VPDALAGVAALIGYNEGVLVMDLLTESAWMPDHAEIVEQLRWHKFPVLDDGFVCLVDVMGDDSSVVQAARVSYGQGTRRVSDDRTLLRYLMRHWHTTPFEMVELKFLVRVPMDCWRQWIRHRMASVNEYSTRYSVAIDATQTTAPDQWRLQATSNAQGSEGLLSPEVGAGLTAAEAELQHHARDVYRQRLSRGVAREQARKDLPLSTYTEAYWKIDLHNLLHFLYLRMDLHAQQEIRQYATTIGQQIVRPLFPMTWEAFVDYQQESLQLTRLEQGVIGRLASGGRVPAEENDFLAAQDPSWAELARCRERDECRAKLVRLGIVKSGPAGDPISEKDDPDE